MLVCRWADGRRLAPLAKVAMSDLEREELLEGSCLTLQEPISMKATKACCFHRCCTAASEMRGNE